MSRGFSGFPREFRDHAAARPWLWASPLVWVAMRGLSSGAAAPYARLGAVVASILAPALFAALWADEGSGVDADRLFESGVLFFLPYPFLFAADNLFRWLSTPLFAGMDRAGMERALDAYGIAAIILPMLASIVSALSLASWKSGLGAWDVLRSGAKTAASNPLFVIGTVAGTMMANRALYAAFSAVSSWPVDARGEMRLAAAAWSYVNVTVKLLGCVAIPLFAAGSGRLEKA